MGMKKNCWIWYLWTDSYVNRWSPWKANVPVIGYSERPNNLNALSRLTVADVRQSHRIKQKETDFRLIGDFESECYLALKTLFIIKQKIYMILS